VSDEDEVVSRRQFFRGLSGDLLRAISEVSGLDRLEEQFSEPPVITNIQDFVSAERQASALSDVFGFLEQLDTGPRREEAEEPPPDPNGPAPEPA
jgi:hypothetical protein